MALLALIVAGACGGGAPTTTPDLPATIQKSAERVSNAKTLRFVLAHERGTTALLPGVVATRFAGQVAVPDRAQITVNAQAVQFGTALEMKIVVDGDRGFISDPVSGAWQSVPALYLPFNVRGFGETLAGIARAVESPTLSTTASGTVNGRRVVVFTGALKSESLTGLISTATTGKRVNATLTVDYESGELRTAVLAGQVTDTDAPDVVRVLTVSDFDKPVEIVVPSA